MAHIVFKDGTTDQEGILQKVNQQLKDKLPEDMVPDYYKIREAMPVHPNGKRDREALVNDREGFITF